MYVLKSPLLEDKDSPIDENNKTQLCAYFVSYLFHRCLLSSSWPLKIKIKLAWVFSSMSLEKHSAFPQYFCKFLGTYILTNTSAHLRTLVLIYDSLWLFFFFCFYALLRTAANSNPLLQSSHTKLPMLLSWSEGDCFKS